MKSQEKRLLLFCGILIILILLSFADHWMVGQGYAPHSGNSSGTTAGSSQRGVNEKNIMEGQTPAAAEAGNSAGNSTNLNDAEMSVGQSLPERAWKAVWHSNGSLPLVIGKEGSLKKGGSAPIYEQPDTSSAKVADLQFNCAVVQEVDPSLENGTGTGSGWIAVQLDGDVSTGYVEESQVELYALPVQNLTDSPVRNGIIEDALSYLGLKFVPHGASLTDGIDCSNFIKQIYKMNRVSIPDRPNKIRRRSNIITEEAAQPGDIIYYDANNGGGHVAIYMGNGFIINSAGHSGRTYPEGGVRICRLQYKDRETYEFCKIF